MNRGPANRLNNYDIWELVHCRFELCPVRVEKSEKTHCLHLNCLNSFCDVNKELGSADTWLDKLSKRKKLQ